MSGLGAMIRRLSRGPALETRREVDASRQQFVNSIDRTICDAFDDMPRVGLRSEAGQFGRSDHFVDGSGSFTTSIRPSEQIIVSTEGCCAQGALGTVVIGALSKEHEFSGVIPTRPLSLRPEALRAG